MSVVGEAGYWKLFIANCALNHVLMKLAIQIDKRLAHSAVYYWNTTGIWTGNDCIWRWEFRSRAAFLCDCAISLVRQLWQLLASYTVKPQDA
ncbi:Ufm1-Specific Protease 2 [Manis pentadactyla]|nr:Ufm1-Specific Protease 2 [Manis pentadactyla]